jgi:hypothetical protein
MSTTILQNQFKEKAKTFLNHKLILGSVSHYYKSSFRKPQIDRAKLIFGQFLTAYKSYPVGQLALLIKRHEDLIMAIIPIPGTPSYNTSVEIATQLITEASNIIDALNLTEYV